MPKVGAKEFPYTKEGIAAAKAESHATGQPVKARKTYAETAHASIARAKSGAALAKIVGGTGSPTLVEKGAALAPEGGAVTGKLSGTAPIHAQKAGDARRGGRPVEAPGEAPESAKEERGESAKKEAGEEGKEKDLSGAIKHPGALTAKAKAAGMSIQAFAEAHKAGADKETRDQANYYLNVLKKAKK